MPIITFAIYHAVVAVDGGVGTLKHSSQVTAVEPSRVGEIDRHLLTISVYLDKHL